MRLYIEINLDNSAFKDNPDDEVRRILETVDDEVRRILETVVDGTLATGQRLSHADLLDSNGNVVGWAEVGE